MNIKPPDSDIKLAQNKGVKFKVCTKAARGKQWMAVAENLNLSEAVDKASSIAPNVYEVGILCVRPAGGFIYWTSRHPDWYNSAVIEIDPV